MSIFDRYATDKNAETVGVDVDFGEGLIVKIARLNNPDARKLRKSLEKPYARLPSLPEDVAEKILNKVMATTVIRGWSGVTGKDGKEIKYTPEAAEKLLEDLPDFRDDILSAALARETFKTEVEEAVKNG